MKERTLQQNADGTWSPARPLPYVRDERGFWRRLWDLLVAVVRRKKEE